MRDRRKRVPAVPRETAVRDVDMPDGMDAQAGEGDLEEAFADVMPDVEVADVIPDPIPDGAFLDRIQAESAAMRRDLERAAVDDQERADDRAAAGVSRAGADAASFVDEFDVGLDPTDTYTDPY